MTLRAFFFHLDLTICGLDRYQHLGEMMTLGTNDGAVSVSFIEGITLDGFLGHTGTSFVIFYIQFFFKQHTDYKMNDPAPVCVLISI